MFGFGAVLEAVLDGGKDRASACSVKVLQMQVISLPYRGRLTQSELSARTPLSSSPSGSQWTPTSLMTCRPAGLL